MRASRETWRRRVERWAQSGQTAAEFAAAGGFHAETLRHWKYKLRREREGKTSTPTLPLVEVITSAATTTADARFEIELARGCRLRVPATFDGEALRRLLAILGEPEAL
jgi:transposase-like protein